MYIVILSNLSNIISTYIHMYISKFVVNILFFWIGVGMNNEINN